MEKDKNIFPEFQLFTVPESLKRFGKFLLGQEVNLCQSDHFANSSLCPVPDEENPHLNMLQAVERHFGKNPDLDKLIAEARQAKADRSRVDM